MKHWLKPDLSALDGANWLQNLSFVANELIVLEASKFIERVDITGKTSTSFKNKTSDPLWEISILFQKASELLRSK